MVVYSSKFDLVKYSGGTKVKMSKFFQNNLVKQQKEKEKGKLNF